jgi:hypothetical protein
MDRVPMEVIVRHAATEIGRYIADQVEEQRRAGKVAVLVEDFTNSLYFMPCNPQGYPDFHTFNYLTFDSLSLTTLIERDAYTPVSMTVEEMSVAIERPMLTRRYDYQERPYVFLWSGRIMSKRKIPLEKLNVTELMKLAQAAVRNREGLVIDEAMRNKVYK